MCKSTGYIILEKFILWNICIIENSFFIYSNNLIEIYKIIHFSIYLSIIEQSKHLDCDF